MQMDLQAASTQSWLTWGELEQVTGHRTACGLPHTPEWSPAWPAVVPGLGCHEESAEHLQVISKALHHMTFAINALASRMVLWTVNSELSSIGVQSLHQLANEHPVRLPACCVEVTCSSAGTGSDSKKLLVSAECGPA